STLLARGRPLLARSPPAPPLEHAGPHHAALYRAVTCSVSGVSRISTLQSPVNARSHPHRSSRVARSMTTGCHDNPSPDTLSSIDSGDRHVDQESPVDPADPDRHHPL